MKILNFVFAFVLAGLISVELSARCGCSLASKPNTNKPVKPAPRR